MLETRRQNGAVHLALGIGTDPQSVFRALATRDGVKIERFELEEPSLDDIFVNVVGDQRSLDGAAKLAATPREGDRPEDPDA